MKIEKFYRQINNNQKNIKFDDMVLFLENLNFVSRRSGSSHIIFTKDGIEEIINLQEEKGEAKPYQIKQIIKIIEKYGLI